MSAGRAALLRAFRLDPSSPRAFFNLALSLLPGPVFRSVREARGRLVASAGEAAASAVPKEVGR
jgi:hypothetical protein